MPRCAAKIKSGKRCTRKATDDCEFCYQHQNPDAAIDASDDDNDNVSGDDNENDNESIILAMPPAQRNVREVHMVDRPHNNSMITGAISGMTGITADDVSQIISKNNETIMTQMQQMQKVNSELVAQMQIIMQMQTMTIGKKKSAMTIDAKARMAFYHDMKTNQDIVKPIRDGLINGNMYIDDKSIPWQLIKRKTDEFFDILPDAKKQDYIIRVTNK